MKKSKREFNDKEKKVIKYLESIGYQGDNLIDALYNWPVDDKGELVEPKEK